MIGHFKVKELSPIPMFIHYGTFGTKSLKDGETLYFNGKYYTYKDVVDHYKKDIQEARTLLTKKYSDPIIRAEQLELFDNLISDSDLKYTIEYGTLTNISGIIKNHCENEKSILKESHTLDILINGLKLTSFLSFACACIITLIHSQEISDNTKQQKINSILEDFEHVCKSLWTQ